MPKPPPALNERAFGSTTLGGALTAPPHRSSSRCRRDLARALVSGEGRRRSISITLNSASLGARRSRTPVRVPCRRGRRRGGVIIQFPLYPGILRNHQVLADPRSRFRLVRFVLHRRAIRRSCCGTPGILNYIIPSGGSKWAIEAPYVIEAARSLGVPVETTILAYAWGDMMTDIIQPFWALPLLAITRLRSRFDGVRNGDLAVYSALVTAGFAFLTSQVTHARRLREPPMLRCPGFERNDGFSRRRRSSDRPSCRADRDFHEFVSPTSCSLVVAPARHSPRRGRRGDRFGRRRASLAEELSCDRDAPSPRSGAWTIRCSRQGRSTVRVSYRSITLRHVATPTNVFVSNSGEPQRSRGARGTLRLERRVSDEELGARRQAAGQTPRSTPRRTG